MNVVKATGLARFTGEGYAEWSRSLQAVFYEKDLWDAVKDDPAMRPTEGPALAEHNKNKLKAFGIFRQSLEPVVLAHVEDCNSAYEMWATLRDMYDKPSWSRHLALRQRFHGLRMAEGTGVQAHLHELRVVVNELASIGDVISEDLQVMVLLTSLPPSYGPLIMSLETAHTPNSSALPGGVSAPTVTPSRSALRIAVTTPRTSASGSTGASARVGPGLAECAADTYVDFDSVRAPQPFPLSLAYVTAALFQEEQRRVRSGESVLAVGPRGSNAFGAAQGGDGHPRRNRKGDSTCHYCQQKGHWVKDCRKKKEDQARGRDSDRDGNNNRGQNSEDSPEACYGLVGPSRRGPAGQTSLWVVDSGASCHCTSDRGWFTEPSHQHR